MSVRVYTAVQAPIMKVITRHGRSLEETESDHTVISLYYMAIMLSYSLVSLYTGTSPPPRVQSYFSQPSDLLLLDTPTLEVLTMKLRDVDVRDRAV